MNIPFHKPILPKSLDTIYLDSIQNGWLTTGLQVKKFENELSKYLNYRYIVALNSCTAGLHLSLAAKKFKKGDKFLAPTLTFVSTIECGEYQGMTPILVDCKKNSFTLDLNFVEDAIKKESSIKAIIPMHYGGELVDMNFLKILADKYGVFIIEDAAHAFESSIHNGENNFNDHVVAFSFYANKNITSAGEGGAIATNNSKIAESIKKLSLHGITKDGWDRFKDFGKWEYDITELGFKYNMTDISASFALWQMKYLEEWKVIRRKIVNSYIDGLNEVKGIILPDISENHSMHLFVIRLRLDLWKISRNDFINKMNNKGIGLAVHYKPIHQLSYYKKMYSLNLEDYPISNDIYNSIVSLPIYPKLTKRELDYIITSIKEIFYQNSS
tara:strand:- start:680 stop:1834 length:1155 start_codon:yes stop_codon:yes gene_type:complete